MGEPIFRGLHIWYAWIYVLECDSRPNILPFLDSSVPNSAELLKNDSSLRAPGGAVEEIDRTITSELVIALCGPIGSPIHDVADVIVDKISEYNYECRILRLSDFIRDYSDKVDVQIKQGSEYQRLCSLIGAGDRLREKFGHNILAQLAVRDIRLHREEKKEIGQPYQPLRVCSIIDSIKNQEELDLLRMVYGDMLFSVGVFSPSDLITGNLKSKGVSRDNEIADLVAMDSGTGDDGGQMVSKTFPSCDMFLRIENSTTAHLAKRVERYVHLMLGSQIVTPTQAETAMYAAAMASANSACLSRQVGACVTDSSGEILSVGWNDVPIAKGGLYSGREPEKDNRCWNDGGYCRNDAEKDLFATELVSALKDIIPLGSMDNAKTIIRNSNKLKGLIEFSRAVHAEMHAIINASQAYGSRIRGGKIYVTTYPCHACARHIIASGIMEVYFIEPYKKSLALKLHKDAMTENEADSDKVKLLAYDGVAPTRYLSLFRAPPDSRKKNGRLIKTDGAHVRPRTNFKSMEALASLEGLVADSSELKGFPIGGRYVAQ